MPTRVEQLAKFVCDARVEDISEAAHRAAFYNGALVRYLDPHRGD